MLCLGRQLLSCCFAVGDGGKWVCGLRYLLQGRSCLVYSLGSAGDTSFEMEILSKTSCQVQSGPDAANSMRTNPLPV